MLERNGGNFSSSGTSSEGFAIETAVIETDNEPTPAADYMGDKFIAARAYQYWEQRGRPFGTPDIDWLNAIDNIHVEMTFASGSDPTHS
jgi:Protein of unknown function (DUF2934)